jgi:hypothetical protein
MHGMPVLWYHPRGHRDPGSNTTMPRKRSTEGRPVDATGTALKAVRLELSPEIHKALRIEAAKQDKSMAALVRTWVEENLARIRKGSK